MTWEEEIVAMQAIGDVSLRMRKPGDWYVSHVGIERCEGGVLSGGCATKAGTPILAVTQHWEWLTSTQHPISIRGERRVKWNGFMWADVSE